MQHENQSSPPRTTSIGTSCPADYTHQPILPPHDHEQTGQSRTAQHLTTCMGAHSRHQPSGTKQPSQANNVNSKKVLAPKVPHADPTPPRSITTTHTPANTTRTAGRPDHKSQQPRGTREPLGGAGVGRLAPILAALFRNPVLTPGEERRKMPRWGFPPQI